jgi:hypothetical protein
MVPMTMILTTKKYRPGQPLTVREAKLLQVGDMVWLSYKEDDLSSWRIHEAVTVEAVLSRDPPKFDLGVCSFTSTNRVNSDSCDDEEQALDEYHSWAGLWKVDL